MVKLVVNEQDGIHGKSDVEKAYNAHNVKPLIFLGRMAYNTGWAGE